MTGGEDLDNHGYVVGNGGGESDHGISKYSIIGWPLKIKIRQPSQFLLGNRQCTTKLMKIFRSVYARHQESRFLKTQRKGL